MSSLIKSAKLAQITLKNSPILLSAIRHAHWNKDFKPGPYPKTEAERLKAAQKYGIHPSEYEVYPDDGAHCTGDYPKLPLVSAESKDPFYPWDNPELKRNFNEPMHVDFDLVREDRYNSSARLRIPLKEQFLQFVGVMGGLFLIYMFFENFKMFHRVTPPQFPQEGKKHYTFESN